jgi:hypothetical protein
MWRCYNRGSLEKPRGQALRTAPSEHSSIEIRVLASGKQSKKAFPLVRGELCHTGCLPHNTGKPLAVLAYRLRTTLGRLEPVIPLQPRVPERRNRQPAQPRRRRQNGDTVDPVGPADGQHLSHIRAPVVPSDREPLYAKDVQHLDRVEDKHGGVARARSIGRQEARLAEAPRGRRDRAQSSIVPEHVFTVELVLEQFGSQAT